MKTEQELLQMVEQCFADYEIACRNYITAYREGSLSASLTRLYDKTVHRLDAFCEVAGIDKADRLAAIWEKVNESK